MSIGTKKEQVLRFVKLGMEWYRGALLAECTEVELETLEQDESFMRQVQVHEVMEEQRLLEKHNAAIEEAVAKGSASAVQWKLERLNPGRWSAQSAGAGSAGAAKLPPIVIRKRSDLDEDDVVPVHLDDIPEDDEDMDVE